MLQGPELERLGVRCLKGCWLEQRDRRSHRLIWFWQRSADERTVACSNEWVAVSVVGLPHDDQD